jgi:hypothetical protein
MRQLFLLVVATMLALCCNTYAESPISAGGASVFRAKYLPLRINGF